MALRPLADFRNEPYADFSKPGNARSMRSALDQARARFGREHEIRIGEERFRTGSLLESLNPSNPVEIVGRFHRANAELARKAIQTADAFFPAWAASSWTERIGMVRKCAHLMRWRKFEFNAWLVLEAGKSWAEAEADTSEAIDFCEYYALLAERLANPERLVQMPGERNELRYLPLGVGVIIPPWNFPLAILVGMTVAALVSGNTVVVKPSSDTPGIAMLFAEVLEEAGCPLEAFTVMVGSGAEVGDLLVAHPRTRFISFTGSREVGLRINELAAKAQPGQIWIKRVVAEMGGKDAIIVDDEADLAAAVEGVAASAYGYQGQKCSACSRAIVTAPLYGEFLERLKARVERITVGPVEDPANYMGPVINRRSMETIQAYMETGRKDGQLITGGGGPRGMAISCSPRCSAESRRSRESSRRRFLAPSSA